MRGEGGIAICFERFFPGLQVTREKRVRRDKSWVTRFLRLTCVVVIGNRLCFQWQAVGIDVIRSKTREIAGDDIVTIGNEESCPWQHRNFNPKTLNVAKPIFEYVGSTFLN